MSNNGNNGVSVAYSVHQLANVNLGGKSVGEARAALASALNIAPEAAAQVNGNIVDEDHILEGGDLLEFVKDAGVKG